MFDCSCGVPDSVQSPLRTICPKDNWTMAALFGRSVATSNLVKGIFHMTLAMRKFPRNTDLIVNDVWAFYDY